MGDKLTLTSNGIKDFQVSRINYEQRHLENYIQIRQNGGYCITLPENLFKRICDWYYENYTTQPQDTKKLQRIEDLERALELALEVLHNAAKTQHEDKVAIILEQALKDKE